MINKTLEEHLKDFNKYTSENAINLNKQICDEIKTKLKEESHNFKRYKVLVHCIIGNYNILNSEIIFNILKF